MLEMNFETNGAPFFTCTVKFGDKTESFCFIFISQNV